MVVCLQAIFGIESQKVASPLMAVSSMGANVRNVVNSVEKVGAGGIDGSCQRKASDGGDLLKPPLPSILGAAWQVYGGFVLLLQGGTRLLRRRDLEDAIGRASGCV